LHTLLTEEIAALKKSVPKPVVPNASKITSGHKDTAVTVVTALVGVLAFVVSIWQGVDTRNFNRWQRTQTVKHDRAAVQPLLTFADEQGNMDTGLYLRSVGVGPALIKTFEIYIDGKPVPNDGEAKIYAMEQAFNLNDPNGPPYLDHYFISGDAIGTNETTAILRLNAKEDDKNKEAEIARMTEILKHVDVKITYESIYHDSVFTAESKEAPPKQSNMQSSH